MRQSVANRRGAFMTTDKLPKISLLVSAESSPSVLYGLYDVLLSAGVDFSDLTIGEPGEKLIDVGIVSASGKPFRCWGGVLVEPQAALDDVRETDVAIVCDMYTPINQSPLGRLWIVARPSPCRLLRFVRGRWCWPRQDCSTTWNLRRIGPIGMSFADTFRKLSYAKTRS